MMSAFEDGQQQRQLDQQQGQLRQQTHSPQSRTPQRFTNEASSNNTSTSSSNGSIVNKTDGNSIMGKVKLRVSSMISDSLTKWFSPTGADKQNSNLEQSSPSSPQQQSVQLNGSALFATTQNKAVKRRQRRIELEMDDDAVGIAVDDGTSAQDLNEEEVQLADNIAEHDLAGEDEQTRRSEYNVSLLRKHQLITIGDDDADEDEEAEEEEADMDELEDGAQQTTTNSYKQQLTNRNAQYRSSMEQMKSKRFRPAECMFSHHPNSQRRRPQLHTSTPTGHDPLRKAAQNRFSSHLNLYGHQRQRDSAYNFACSAAATSSSSSSSNNNSSSEAAVATSGDLPIAYSSRRSLNIAPMTERSETALPSYKRQSLLGHPGALTNWRSRYQTIGEVPANEEEQQQQQTARQEANNNNNDNNNKLQNKRSRDSQTDSESTESQAAVEAKALSEPFGLGLLHNNNNNNNNSNIFGSGNGTNNNCNSLFYGNLQSRKSVFNTSASTKTLLHHHNSTLSLNSLSCRRRFNASIYGSTSALSDSRLLSSNMSSHSPFYQGPTAFGGRSANNRSFDQRNSVPIINSGSSSPAPSNSDSVYSHSGPLSVGRQLIGSNSNSNYAVKSINMRPGPTAATEVNPNLPGLSLTAQRILNLLANHRTPLMDARKMGSSLREHQLQRQSRHTANSSKPYAYPINSSKHGSGNNSNNNDTSHTDNSSKLLVPTMIQLLERRRLHRVPTNTRSAAAKSCPMDEKNLFEKKRQEPKSVPTSRTTSTNNTTIASSTTDSSGGVQKHTNKMRSRLSHQLRKDSMRNVEEQLPPAPVDLPNIRFPAMTNEPKFDLIIAPPSASKSPAQSVASKVPKLNNNSTTPSTSISSNSNSNSNSNNNNININKDSSNKNSLRKFQFATPMSLNVSEPTEEFAPLQKRRKQTSYSFSSPLSLEEYVIYKIVECSNMSDGSVLDTPKESAETVAPASGGFGDLFKKSANEWECDSCMLRNKQECDKCVACEAPKPKPKAAADAVPTSMPSTHSFNYPTSDGFGDRFKQPTGNWECQVCMVSNKDGSAKCVACETPRPNKGSNAAQVSTPSVSSSNSNSFSSGFGDAFKRPANMWECGSCMIMNSVSLNECLACQAPNPKGNKSSSGTSSSSSSNSSNSNSKNFKFGFVPSTTAAPAPAVEYPKPDAGFQQLIAAQKASSWYCETCMAQNDINRTKCISCEQIKMSVDSVESSGSSTVPKFTFGFQVKSPAAAAATTTTTAVSQTTSTTSTAATVPQFKFGFAAAGSDGSKDVADSNKPQLATVTATTAAAAATATVTTAPSQMSFKFGVQSTGNGSAAGFQFGSSQKSQQKEQPQLELPEASKSVASTATTGSGMGLFAAPSTFTFGSNTVAAATATASSTGATGVRAAEVIPTTKMSSSPLLGRFASNTAVSSSSGNTITTTSSSSSFSTTSSSSSSSGIITSSSSGTSTSSNNRSLTFTPPAGIFNFSSNSNNNNNNNNIVSSTSTSNSNLTATGTRTTPAIFGSQTPAVSSTSIGNTITSFAAPTIAAAATATVAPTTSTFVFGGQVAVSTAETSAKSTTTSSSNFFFGSPATTTTTSSSTTTLAAAGASGSGNASIFGSIASSTSNSSSFAAGGGNSTLFTFGSASNTTANTSNGFGGNFTTPTFTFGSKTLNTTPSAAANAVTTGGMGSSTTTTTTTAPTMGGFSWPTAPAAPAPAAAAPAPAAAATTTTTKAASGFSASPFGSNSGTNTLPTSGSSIFGSGSSLFGGNSSGNASTKTTIFGATTAAATGAAAATQPSGNGPVSTVFGNVSSPFGASSASAAGTGSGGGGFSSPLTNILRSNNDKNNLMAPATSTTPLKAFDFGNAIGGTPAATGSIFSFGATSSVSGASGSSAPMAKPAFNFTAPAGAQPTTFNFTANPSTSGNAGNSDLFPRTERLFQFGATSTSADAGTSSSMMPAATNQMFNFTGSAQQTQLQSTQQLEQLNAEPTPEDSHPDASTAAAVEMEIGVAAATTAAVAAAANNDASEQQFRTTIMGQGLGREQIRERRSAAAEQQQHLRHNDSNKTTTICDYDCQQQQLEEQRQKIPHRTATRTTRNCPPKQQQPLTTKVVLQRRSSRLHERQQQIQKELQQLAQQRRRFQQQKQQRLLNKYRFVRSPTTAAAAAAAATTSPIRVVRQYKCKLVSRRQLQLRKSNGNHGNINEGGGVAAASANVLRSRYKVVRRRSATD